MTKYLRSHTIKRPQEHQDAEDEYSRTSQQRPPWGQRKVAIIERWPLWGSNTTPEFFGGEGERATFPFSKNVYFSI